MKKASHFILVSIPNCQTVMRYQASAGESPYPSLTDYLGAFASANDMLFLPLLHDFAARGDASHLYINCLRHFSEQECRVVTDKLADCIGQKVLVPH